MKFSSVLKHTNTAKFRFLACTLSGILSSVPYFYPKLFFVEWVSFVPFFCIFFTQEKLKYKTVFFYGFLNQFIKTVIVLSMFKELIYLDIFNISKAAAVLLICLAVLFISLIQSIPFGICAVFSRFLITNGKSTAINIIGIPIIYTFAELFKTIIERTNLFGFLGFPWVMTHITQAEFICGIQISSVFGGHFVTILILTVNLLISYAIVKKKYVVPVILSAALITANCIFGTITLMKQETGKEISAIIYQDNNSSYDKWSLSSVDVCDEFIADMEIYLSQNEAPDIILMSETVFPITFDPDISKCGKNAKYVIRQLQDFTKRHKTSLVCGAFSKDEHGKYNSLFMFDNGQMVETKYDKCSLVPFGEYVPHEKILSSIPFLSNLNLSGSSLSPGRDTVVFKADNAVFGCDICYDSIFYYNASNAARNGAEVILLSTNDSWYNDSAAINQHYSQAVFRSVETKRSIIRCATTGVSGIIDSHGKTKIKNNILKKEILSGTCRLENEMTVFCKYGYTYLYALVFSVLIYGFVSYITRKTKQKN